MIQVFLSMNSQVHIPIDQEKAYVETISNTVNKMLDLKIIKILMAIVSSQETVLKT